MTTVRSHNRSRAWVKGHSRNGHWVNEHPRNATIIGEHTRSYGAPYLVSSALQKLSTYTSVLTYPTKCWWCGAYVFFHRSNNNGGCALFNKLGWPWPIHECWQHYRDHLLRRVSIELDALDFNGRTYIQPRTRIIKDRRQDSFCGIGFVDAANAQPEANLLHLRSCRGCSTVTLVPIRFVPCDRLDEYLVLQVPRDRKDLLTPYSIHQIEASWIKRGHQWLCLVSSSRVPQTHSRPAGRARSILKLNGRCFYCNMDLKNVDAWGLDDAGHGECGDCGRMRFRMPSDEFTKRVQQISQSVSARSRTRI